MVKFKAKYHSCLFLGPCRVLQVETQSRTKCAAVCKMCIFWCYDYINLGNSIVVGFVNEALSCSGFIEKLRLEYTEYRLGSRTIHMQLYAVIYAVMITLWSFGGSLSFVCPLWPSGSSFQQLSASSMGWSEVKVNLPAAFQDFVAIMLGYNAAIAILKARFPDSQSPFRWKFRAAVRSTGFPKGKSSYCIYRTMAI